MRLIVGGFDEGDTWGQLFLVTASREPSVKEFWEGEQCGPVFTGVVDVVNRLLLGHGWRYRDAATFTDVLIEALHLSPTDESRAWIGRALEPFAMPIPYALLSLQDAVDLAVFLIRTTIGAARFVHELRGVGGPVDVAVITREGGFRFLQRKQLGVEPEPDPVVVVRR